MKSLSALLSGLTLLTIAAITFYHFGFNTELILNGHSGYSLRVNTDQDHGGLTTGHMTINDDGSIELICEVSHAYRSPFCEVSFDLVPSDQAKGLDFSQFSHIKFDVEFEGPGEQKVRFITRNRNPEYSSDDPQSDKFNLFEFNPELYDLTHPLKLDFLNVPKWWIDYYQHPVHLTAVDISNTVSIELGTSEFVAEGTNKYLVRSIRFSGKVLPFEVYTKIIIAIWVLVLSIALSVTTIEYRKRLLAEKAMMRVIKELEGNLVTDPLTKLRNRSHLDSVFSGLERAQQTGTSITITMIDIDHFKAINDTYGHLVGDEVLTQLGAVLKSHYDERDVVIRWGGEEFMVIQMGQNQLHSTQQAKSLQAKLKRQPWPKELNITLSGGVTTLTHTGIKKAIATADEALYQAKQNGRDQVLST